MGQDALRYETSINLDEVVDEMAKLVQRRVDQAVLDKVATELEQYGYVKVVRCRDCASWARGRCYKHAYEVTGRYDNDCEYIEDEGVIAMDADGYCSLGVPHDEHEA